MAKTLSTIIGITTALVLYVPSASAATLQFSTGQGYAVGETFQVGINVSTGPGQAINAVSAAISYPSDRIELKSISKSGSVISMWATEPTFSNSTGSASLEGVILNPGFTGDNGLVATLIFKVKAVGVASLTFSQASVLANDGQGTNVLSAAPAKSIYLGDAASDSATTAEAIPAGAPSAPAVSSVTHPDSSKWYHDTEAIFSWSVPDDVTAVRLQYDKSPIATPAVVYSPAIGEKKLTGLKDGVYYFHAQFQNAAGWGAISHFRFRIDTVPPAPFQIQPAHPEVTNDPRPILYFNTTDDVSGMDRYEVKVGNLAFMTISAEVIASNPYTPPIQGIGLKTVVVNAYDRAGNVTTASTEIEIDALEPPTIQTFPAEMEEGDILKILGNSYPSSTVTVFIKSPSGEEREDIVRTAASSGNFTMIWPRELDAGIYTFTAMVVDNRGGQSLRTDSHTVVVRPKAVYHIGSLIFSYLSIVLMSVVALALLIGVIMYSHYHLSLLRHRIKRSLSEAEHSVHKRFHDLQEEMATHLAVLESVNKRRQLTKEEALMAESFRKFLGVVEHEIVNKLEKVKRNVD